MRLGHTAGAFLHVQWSRVMRGPVMDGSDARRRGAGSNESRQYQCDWEKFLHNIRVIFLVLDVQMWCWARHCAVRKTGCCIAVVLYCRNKAVIEERSDGGASQGFKSASTRDGACCLPNEITAIRDAGARAWPY